MKIIKLPPTCIKGNLYELLDILYRDEIEKDVILDFSDVGFYTPGPLMAILAAAKSWVDRGCRVRIRNWKNCKAFSYLNRMDFFKVCGISVPDDANRRNGVGRFITIQDLKGMTEFDVEKLSADVAKCIAPDMAEADDPDDSGLFDAVQYSVSEITLNVIQHSMGKGFLCAQFYPARGNVCIGIADNGIGVKESFRRSGSPFFSDGMTDIQILDKALELKVSSKTHISGLWGEVRNAGVGLTFVKELSRITQGHFFIASGLARHDGGGTKVGKIPYQGVVCELSFLRSELSNFNDRLTEIKNNLGVTSSAKIQGLFK